MRLGLAADIDTALEQRSQQDEEAAEEAFSVFNADDDDFVGYPKDLASEAPVIQRVNQIIQRSLELERLTFISSVLRMVCASVIGLTVCCKKPHKR